MRMDFSAVMNLVLGGGLVATIIAIITLKSTVREARAKAEKATAEAETVRIDNTEHATRILIENIVEPLKEELNENRKALQATRREMARLRKAIDTANSCRHHDDCPVLYGMREYSKEQDGGEPEQQPVVKRRQRVKREAGLLMAGIPKSAVSLTIPPDSLRKLPSGSSYHSRNGQAGLTVKSDAAGNIIAEASCDSLQRLVLCYEEELTRIRNETHEDSFTVETEFERRFSPVKIALAAFITGCVAGIVLTFKIKKQ
ncbi:hypothetical protein BFINE_23200 [Bacteroides finegoldii DSM 17565]|nr:hypothetical protein BFINE_23200 [Bacteroides finegoldii DSM 17565]